MLLSPHHVPIRNIMWHIERNQHNSMPHVCMCTPKMRNWCKRSQFLEHKGKLRELVADGSSQTGSFLEKAVSSFSTSCCLAVYCLRWKRMVWSTCVSVGEYVRVCEKEREWEIDKTSFSSLLKSFVNYFPMHWCLISWSAACFMGQILQSEIE